MNRTTALTSALLATWALVACGGGSNDPAVAAAPDTAGSTPAASPAPTPAASSPEPAASAPSPAASAPEPSASSPEPVASAPEPAASAPAPAASSPSPAPSPAPVPAPPPAGTDGSYSDKTTFTMQELESCPKTTGATLDLVGAHTCLTGSFWGAQTDASRVIMTGQNSPYGCKLNVIPPVGANLDAYHYVGVVEHTTPSTAHPAGEYLETHISMSPNHVRNLDLQGFAVIQNSYSRAVEANGDDVIRLDWAGKGNNLVPSDQFEKTGEIINRIQLVARKASGGSTWRVNFAIYDSYTSAAGLSCVSTVYK